jgi:hypothetical protein
MFYLIDSITERASKSEIFSNLHRLLGEESVEVSEQVESLIVEDKKDAALALLKEYDAKLGGIGIYTIKDRKPSGIYRAMFYIEHPFHFHQVENYTRPIVSVSCSYLEELLKKMVRTWPWERIKGDRLPLGTLVKRIEKRLPVPLAQDLNWLSQKVYNFAKHHYNFENDEEEPEHYFSISEAVAVYLIVRKLGLELESFSGKSAEELSQEY